MAQHRFDHSLPMKLPKPFIFVIFNEKMLLQNKRNWENKAILFAVLIGNSMKKIHIFPEMEQIDCLT